MERKRQRCIRPLRRRQAARDGWVDFDKSTRRSDAFVTIGRETTGCYEILHKRGLKERRAGCDTWGRKRQTTFSQKGRSPSLFCTPVRPRRPKAPPEKILCPQALQAPRDRQLWNGQVFISNCRTMNGAFLSPRLSPLVSSRPCCAAGSAPFSRHALKLMRLCHDTPIYARRRFSIRRTAVRLRQCRRARNEAPETR